MSWLRLLLILAAVLLVMFVLPNPWAFHIGGQFTPLGSWSGYGAVQASNGGRYVLFVRFTGTYAVSRSGRTSCAPGRGCDNMVGEARLCTASGTTRTFALRGIVHGWWNTDGARTTIALTGGAPDRLPSGWVVAFHGAWDGPALALDSPDNSFTEVFTPAGAIRRTTSTADHGTARVTLGPGSEADFAQACRSMVPRARSSARSIAAAEIAERADTLHFYTSTRNM